MSTQKILLVDDTAASLKLLRAIFDGEGLDVATATDGLEALEVLLQEKIDLMITDVLMPNMDGYHLCYKVRTNPKLKDIPIVIYTATYVSLSEAKIAMDMGASYYIRKPASSQKLMSTVKEILAKPKTFPHKYPTRRGSTELMQQYSAKLIDKLERSNIDLEQAKNTIEQRENYFRALVENDYSITVLANGKFEITYRSPSWTALLGWSAVELDKMKSGEITHPDDKERQQFLMKEVIEHPDKVFPMAMRLRHKNGSYLWLEGVAVNKLSDPNVKGIVTNLHNVTERKLAEEKLERTTSRLKEAQFIAHLGNWEVDLVNNSGSWSEEIYNIYGYRQGEIEPTTESFLSFMHPEDLLNASKRVEQAFTTLADESFGYRFIRKGGEVRYGYTKWRFELNNAGRPVRIYGIIQDITDKKEAEQKLAAGEQRFRALIENSSDAIVLNDKNANNIYHSPSVTRILGYSPDEMKGGRYIDHIHPDDQEVAWLLLEKSVTSPARPVPFQYRVRHKQGHYLWLEGYLTNLTHDPSVNAFVANYRDITPRKEAEEALARTLRRFEQAQQIAHLGHWELDFATKKSTWSDEAFRVYGIEPHSIGPSEDLFLEHIHPDDLERVQAITQHAQQTLTPFSFYHRILQPSGNIRDMFSVGQFEFDLSGRPVALYGISQDITELAEKELKLEQVNKELATFIYKAYHDLRSPIVSVQGIVNLAKSEVSDKIALRYFSIINEIVQKQNKMLLSLIKVMSIRERDLVLTSVGLNELVSNVLEAQKSTEGFGSVKFMVNCAGTLQTDRELLFDTISTLVENAIFYRDFTRMIPEVRITSSIEDGGKLLLVIEDNGLGISEEAKPKVFDLFYRGTEQSKGSGLGLFLVKNAVEKLSGSIEFASEPGKGTAFRVSLPALKPE